MADAAAAQPQVVGGGSTDQGYNSYVAHGSVYTSPPSNQGHVGHTGGGYGSVYGTNYGYWAAFQMGYCWVLSTNTKLEDSCNFVPVILFKMF